MAKQKVKAGINDTARRAKAQLLAKRAKAQQLAKRSKAQRSRAQLSAKRAKVQQLARRAKEQRAKEQRAKEQRAKAQAQVAKAKQHAAREKAQQKERAAREKAREKAVKEREKARITKQRERERAVRMKERARIALQKAKAKDKARKEKEAARAKVQKEKEIVREKAQKEKELAKQKALEAKIKAQELLRAGRGRPGRPAKRDRDAERALLARAELKPEEAEARRTRLKNLIKLGKERGYLTYAEVNDHLPDDMVDAEQIESIISTFNDMSIQVFDEAPDAETLLISENAPAVVPDEDAEEAAEAALSTVDPEFGRTTDPVRMYMREMGSVELLTREGEIGSPSASKTA